MIKNLYQNFEESVAPIFHLVSEDKRLEIEERYKKEAEEKAKKMFEREQKEKEL